MSRLTRLRAEGLRVFIATAVVVANMVGAVVVVALTLVVLPLPDDREVALAWWIGAAATYASVAAIVGVALGVAGDRSLVRHWYGSDLPASPRVRSAILRLPLQLFWLQVALWFVAACGFGALSAVLDVERGVWVGLTVMLTGITTASLVYLLAERILRPIASRAMVDAPPAELERGRGVALRSLLSWALGSGITLVGLLALGIRALAPSEISLRELAVAVVVLAATGLLVGLRAVTLAARATADPIKAVARAMSEVHRGDYSVRVPVYDRTEIGRLQLGFNTMVAGLEERERIRAAFGTYVDPSIAEHVLRAGTDLAGEEVELSMLFLDIRDFTGFAEQTPAHEVVGTINRLFERAVPLVREHGGHVDKFVGDGLLAVFGAPVRLANHAAAAVDAALAIADATEDEFGGSLSVGIGVNTGVVVAGNVGGAGRFEFSVIGDPVNVAARIESATRVTGDTVLVSARTRDLLDDGSLVVEERPGLNLKGKAGVTTLYAVTRG